MMTRGETTTIDIIVAEGFVLTELAAVVDTLRICNRISALPPFSWTYRSAKGGMVRSSAEAMVETEQIPQRPDAHYLFVLGNSDQDCPALSLTHTIAAYTHRQSLVVLLAEAASRYINDSGADMAGHTTHWENSELIKERHGYFGTNHAIAAQSGEIMTCAGMGATVDVMLALIGRHVSQATKIAVANILLHDKIRDFSTVQPFSGAKGTGTGDRELDQCIEIMQANIEDPIPIGELVAVLGMSNRSLERKFRTQLDTTPNRFYRELRLTKANNLLLNTTMSVRDVGLACGFSNGFSGLYKSFYGITPFALRKLRRGEKNN
ncbi:helix-turn-helix domain-containing protein [Cognatishimia sp. SS12]|uniref:GlxA family transcriptional regulator n=1 Tax=Cognatishimia sp. SS12 TaxID=2979465 RepID=UPI00232CBE41|nr:helix-turn-helix domain-containing protein [Cognatishimia sp. SS12]MDC0737943.1 helix-turn-helix domain-containing protein [Cognatishimia sp. SS12]